jgi:hypothetical protein
MPSVGEAGRHPTVWPARVRRRFVACAIAIAAFAIPAIAAADGPLVALDYERAPALVDSCPDESSFRNLVVARLGADPFTALGSDAEDRVHVSLSLLRGRVQADAALLRRGQPPRAPRALEGAPRECEAIVTALATTVAIALDPRFAPAATKAPPSATTPRVTAAPSEPPAPDPFDAPAVPPENAPPEGERSRLFASAAPVISVGVAPSPSLGGEAGLGIRRGAFSLQLLARAEATPADVHVASGDRLGAAIYTGSLVPCGTVSHARICGLLRVGAFEGDAPDLAQKHPGALFYAAVGLRVGYELRLSEALSLEPAFEVVVPLERNSLVISGESVWTAPVASAGAALTLLFSF